MRSDVSLEVRIADLVRDGTHRPRRTSRWHGWRRITANGYTPYGAFRCARMFHRRAHNAYGVIRRIADGSRRHGRRSGPCPRWDSPATPDAPVARMAAYNRERLYALRAASRSSEIRRADGSRKHGRRSGPCPRWDSPATPDVPVAQPTAQYQDDAEVSARSERPPLPPGEGWGEGPESTQCAIATVNTAREQGQGAASRLRKQ